MNALELLLEGPVMPVIVVRDAAVAVDLAIALTSGGIRTLEVTLRTSAAFAAIRLIRDAVPGAIVGAGTVLNRAQWERAVDAGAQFGVSPGLTSEVASAARSANLPFLPGVGTATEALRAHDEGFSVQKLFPAEAIGGRSLLKALYGPFPDLRFCPTGGINPENALDYLALPNVVCVGGSWLVPDEAVENRDWLRITRLARAAAAMRTSPTPMVSSAA
jgi:2-dehydro-3-deoxyphosphogluconate aldolase/(4S)-4-hydroxy-2-oxoglutarate aldolase